MTIMRFATRIPDGTDVVRSVLPGYYYPCPSLDVVDAHIAGQIRGFLSPFSSATEQRKAQAWCDIDRLLERRLWLEIAAEPNVDRRHSDAAA